MKTIGLILLACILPVFVVNADAEQKKKKADEQQVQPQKASDTFRSLLAKHEGMETNRGKLTRVGTDFVILTQDEGFTVYSLSAVASVKVIKPEEEGDKETLEIKFFAMD
jgi:hypothetical protein